MEKIIILLITIFLVLNESSAQIAEILGIRKVNSNSISSIGTRYETQGYYIFYKVEKAKKGHTNYKLDIFNDNLVLTHSIDIVKPNNVYLLEGKFNGTHFCFSFLNGGDKTIDYDIYDLNGKLSGRSVIEDVNKLAINVLISQINSDDFYLPSALIEVPNKGFVYSYSGKDDNKKITLVMIDNKGKKVWQIKSKDNSKNIETTNLLYSDEDNVIVTVESKKGMSAKDYDSELRIVSVNEGKVVTKTQFTDNNYFNLPFGVDYDPVAEKYFVFGEYYEKKNGKANFKEKEGFFMVEMGKSGNESQLKRISWLNDFSRKIKISDKGKMDNGIGIFVHKIMRLKDGNYYIVAEQFNKTASGIGIASAAISGSRSGASLVKISVLNMMLIRLNSDFTVDDIEIVEKRKHNFELPRGAETVNENLLGFYVKNYGGFSYAYSAINRANDNFTSVYMAREKGSKTDEESDYYAGVISLDEEANLVQSRVQMKAAPTWAHVLPAKSGYLVVFEYFKKEKKGTFRMEKFDI